MKSVLVFFAMCIAVVNVSNRVAEAQVSRIDGSVLVAEDSLLSSNHKKIVLVVAKNISGPARVELQTMTSEGIVNRFAPQDFPNGLTKGQAISVWNGEFNAFHATPWLYFMTSIISGNVTYYAQTMFPIHYREQYKEPMITSISEVGGYTSPYTITVRGIFDTTEPSLILINNNLFIPPKTITQTPPGIITFIMPSNSFAQFPPGKYLLTLCQTGHCDTMIGRHR